MVVVDDIVQLASTVANLRALVTMVAHDVGTNYASLTSSTNTVPSGRSWTGHHLPSMTR
jgi:hypothetical protein